MRFFNWKDKEYTSCEWIESGIAFSPLDIRFCCLYKPNGDVASFVISSKNGQYDLDKFLAIKKRTVEMAKKGVMPKFCEGCFLVKKQRWKKSKIFKNIVLNLNYRCNADCIYCFTHNNKSYFNKVEDIKIYDLLKKLIKNKQITKDTHIDISGGEPLLHKEFDNIINLFLDNNLKKLEIYSSGIKYSQTVERAISESACKLYISIDAGTKELHQKIKNINEYDLIWENIKKYCRAQKKGFNAVLLKYIIVPDLNDNKEEIDIFMNKLVDSGARGVVIDIERNFYSEIENNKIPENRITDIIKLIKYIETKAKTLGIEIVYFPASIYARQKYMHIYNKIDTF